MCKCGFIRSKFSSGLPCSYTSVYVCIKKLVYFMDMVGGGGGGGGGGLTT